jgi:hypothetical protein
LASSAITSPAPVVISGLISTRLASLLLIQAEPERELARLVILQPGIRRDGNRENLLRRFLCHLLDIHAAGRRGDERHAADLTVDEHRQVQLTIDFGALLDVDDVDRQPLGTRLVGDQLDAEHRLRVFTHLVGTARQLDAAGLAASAGVYLGLDDPQIAAELFRSGDRGSGGLDGNATRHGNAVVGKQSFGLVFVQIHWIVSLVVLTGRRILSESGHGRKAT